MTPIKTCSDKHPQKRMTFTFPFYKLYEKKKDDANCYSWMSQILSTIFCTQHILMSQEQYLHYLNTFSLWLSRNQTTIALLFSFESDNILQWVRIAEGKVVFHTLSALRCGQTGHRDGII